MVKSFLRGHPVIFEDGEWLYNDTKTPTVDNERECGHCEIENSIEGHDGCIGTLPGVINACCGHGIEDEAYIQFDYGHCVYGHCVYGIAAIKIINRLKKGY